MGTLLRRLMQSGPLDLRYIAAAFVIGLAVVWAVQPNALGLGQTSQAPAGAATAGPTGGTAGASSDQESFLPQHQEPALLPETAFTWPSALGLMLKLGVVVALIYVSARGLRSIMLRTGVVGSPSDGPVEVLATTALGPRKMIHVVSLGNRLLVLGATDQQVALLSEIHDPVEVLQLRQQLGLEEGAAEPFAPQLKQALADPGPSPSTNGQPVQSLEELAAQEPEAALEGTLRQALARLQDSRSRLGSRPAVRRPAPAPVPAGSPAPQQREPRNGASPGGPAARVAAAAISAAQAANRAAARNAYTRDPAEKTEDG